MNCRTCKFFDDETYSKVSTEDPRGYCRIYPPKLVQWEDFSLTKWPEVSGECDWCGEYVRFCPDD